MKTSWTLGQLRREEKRRVEDSATIEAGSGEVQRRSEGRLYYPADAQRIIAHFPFVAVGREVLSLTRRVWEELDRASEIGVSKAMRSMPRGAEKIAYESPQLLTKNASPPKFHLQYFSSPLCDIHLGRSSDKFFQKILQV